MYAFAWLYMYGVGGLIYVLGAIAGIRAGVIDLHDRNERTVFIGITACLVLFAAVHALFQFVLPFGGQG